MTNPAIKVAPPVLALPTTTAIFDALTHAHGLAPRESQLRLARRVRDTLATGGICCVEAPTGTGKTLGYLAGALDAQAHSGNPVPVVVATATVGLQEQILRHDIPRLAEVGAVDAKKVVVAKGRNRYFCPRTAALLEDKKMQDGQFDMFEAGKHVADGGVQIALDMLKGWREYTWDGDKDSWPGVIPSCWESSCGASSETCVGRVCEHYDRCPYMQSRTRLAQAQVIVANHDIVLADLAQRAEEQSSTALPPKSYALIFDEAHNLPEKAVSTMQAKANLTDLDWLRKIEAHGEQCLHLAKVSRAMAKATEFPPNIFSQGAALLLADVMQFADSLKTSLKFNTSGVYSWGLKPPPDDVQAQVAALAGQALALVSALKTVSKALAEYADEEVGTNKAFGIRLLSQTHKLAKSAQDLYSGLSMFCHPDQLVRWVSSRADTTVVLHTQPLEGKEVLEKLLWGTGFPVALVSATLQISGSFERFRSKSGLPAHAVTEALPPVFDYSRGFLHLPRMSYEPGQAGYEAELVTTLDRLFEKEVAPGMLVLFTSREGMRRAVRAVSDQMAEKMLVQDSRPIPELVAEHKARIDRGLRSVLVGLDSMAEGLDLPGKYCGHVVVTRLPFAVPGDPVEEARHAHMGRAWFEDAYLADMLTMLIQAAGRLIRRESDHGVISVLDRRLTTKRYSLKALNALPAFSRCNKLSEYEEAAKARKFDMGHKAKPKPALYAVAQVAPTEFSKNPAVAPKTRNAAPAKKEHPLANFWRSKEGPAAMGSSMVVSAENLMTELMRMLPPSKGPFDHGEFPYLAHGAAIPCLGAGTPASVFAERQLPQATMLGILHLNTEWDKSAPAWRQVFSLRPDLVQFAQVLRNHQEGVLDERNALLPEQTCCQQLENALSRYGALTTGEIFDALAAIEAQVVTLLAGNYRLPSKDFMAEMVSASAQLAIQLPGVA